MKSINPKSKTKGGGVLFLLNGSLTWFGTRIKNKKIREQYVSDLLNNLGG